MMKKYILTIAVLVASLFTSQEVIPLNPPSKGEHQEVFPLNSQSMMENRNSIAQNTTPTTNYMQAIPFTPKSKLDSGVLEPYNYFGGYLHYNMNLHSADFSYLPGYFSCCPKFKSGFGNGFSIGGLFEMPLANKFYLGVRLGYSLMNAKLKVDEVIGNSLDAEILGATNRINVEYSIDSKLSALTLEPQVFYNFYNNFTGAFGLKGAFLLTKTFSQKEEILSPDDIVYKSNLQTTRSVYNNQDIPDAKSFLTFATFGLAYNFRMNSGMLIVPEIRYELALYSLSSVSWSPNALNIGVAVKFPIHPSIKPTFDSTFIQRDTNIVLAKGISESKISLIDTKKSTKKIEYDEYKLNRTDITEFYKKEMPQLPNKPIANIVLKGLDFNGKYVDMPELIIEELETDEAFPLLPQVFFAKNSSDLTKANINLLTADQAPNFSEDNLKWDAMSIYSDILNIIAKRIKENPSATFTITGCNNDVAEEAGNIPLSTARAEAVKNYFQDVWGIDTHRMIIETRNLPENPANNLRPQGLEENRRVEISSANSEIMKPIRLSEIHRSANPPIVRIIPTVQTSDKIDNWTIDISQDSSAIRSYNGIGKPDSIDWKVEVNPVPMYDSPVNAKLTAKDSYGQIGTDEESIKIQQKTIKKKKVEMLGDKRVERFSLILFDYDKSEITERQQEIINEIKAKIKPNSQVTITGFTDKTGDASHNLKLAKDRAMQVEALLDISNKSNVKVEAAGSNFELYDNDLPAGRSYSRTVKIVVETPEK